MSFAQAPGPATHAGAENALLSALTLGDLPAIEKALLDGADPNTTTPLFKGPVWLSSLLMGQKAIFNAMTGSGRVSLGSAAGRRAGPEALAIAAARDYPDIVQFLLSHGVDVDARLSVGATPLLIAAANGNAEIVRILIARHADVNAADQFGDTPLMAAVRSGSLPAVSSLLKAGAGVNTADKEGRTAVWWAARSGRKDVVKQLIGNAADIHLVDKSGSSPFGQASKAGYVSVARLLRGEQAASSSELPSRTVAEAIEASLPGIQSGVELWWQRTGCGSCHHTVLGTQAILLAKRYGKKLDDALTEKQLARFRQDLIRNEKKYAAAAADRLASTTVDQPSEDLAFGIAGATLPVVGLSGLSFDSFDNLALVLANLQFADGRWIHGMARFPIESSDLLTTAYAIRTLRAYAPVNQKPRVDQQIALAVEWLRREPGSTTNDLIGRLYGLVWAGWDESFIQEAARQLLREQRNDGSWAQKPGMNGDAYATGTALFALYQTRQLSPTAGPYRRGVKYLLRTQEEDGSWLTPTRAIPLNGYLESGSPHGKHQFISFAGTCWATMALIAGSAGPLP